MCVCVLYIISVSVCKYIELNMLHVCIYNLSCFVYPHLEYYEITKKLMMVAMKEKFSLYNIISLIEIVLHVSFVFVYFISYSSSVKVTIWNVRSQAIGWIGHLVIAHTILTIHVYSIYRQIHMQRSATNQNRYTKVRL